MRLTESQRLALVEVSEGVDMFAHPVTLHSLAGRRLITQGEHGWQVTDLGHDEVRKTRAMWPAFFARPADERRNP